MGAEVVAGGGVDFRVWAPGEPSVSVRVDGRDHPLEREQGGYFRAVVRDAAAGTRYRFVLASGTYPDPASRAQPDGPHGESEVVDPSRFAWTDAAHRGVALEGQVVYEMHVGTFTREGTWAAAARELPELAALGVTLVEMMPVAEFPGRFNWGYDGVDLFAPAHVYGAPDDLRRFVDRAHALGLGVVLDVVYNHLGPDGNYLPRFSPSYFTDDHPTEWGKAVNFDGPGSGPVRELFVANAGYWIDEFHVDGLRLDATQNIHDDSPEHVITAMRRRVAEAARGRATLVLAENEPQRARVLAPVERGGFGADAVWNDDFHHAAVVALTGRRRAYYSDYAGSAQELLSAVKRGYLYQGQRFPWQDKRRGEPALDAAPARFVLYLENHDQVANGDAGLRLASIASPGKLRAMTALFLLAPGTPMLFQGQEFASSAPFAFFADHVPELAPAVEAGRRQFLAQFPHCAVPAVAAALPKPHDPATFERCKLDFSERQTHAAVYQMTKDLLKLRRDDPAFRAQEPGGVDGAVLSEHAFVLRYFQDNGEDRLLVVNFGRDLHLLTCPEP
ncbi:MAG TPA: malto-oligosyltrehalose trehalohydrolase, partial [Minicystis sp.]|nr:malto-oligosyltrehalose trehalohydrolase [Minicystis sp.]